MIDSRSPITSFQGPYRFLSNFYGCPVVYEGVEYPSAEHAYQAAKTTNLRLREQIRRMHYAASAKQFGRQMTLRHEWTLMRVQVMHAIVLAKFRANPQLRDMLLATGDRPLIEGNDWGDHFWGISKGTGTNHLGQILMDVREALR